MPTLQIYNNQDIMDNKKFRRPSAREGNTLLENNIRCITGTLEYDENKKTKKFNNFTGYPSFSLETCKKKLRTSNEVNSLALLTGYFQENNLKLINYLAIDIDIPKNEEIDGNELFKDYQKYLDEFVYKEQSGSGGIHYIFKLDPENQDHHNIVTFQRINKNDKTYSIDVISNKCKATGGSSYIFIAPSYYTRIIDGKETKIKYVKLNDISLFNTPVLPDFIYKLLDLDKKNNNNNNNNNINVNIGEPNIINSNKRIKKNNEKDDGEKDDEFDEIKNIVDKIPPEAFFKYDHWVHFGIHLKKYNAKGLKLYKRVSSYHPNFNMDETVKKFETYPIGNNNIEYFKTILYKTNKEEFNKLNENNLFIPKSQYLEVTDVDGLYQKIKKIIIQKIIDAKKEQTEEKEKIFELNGKNYSIQYVEKLMKRVYPYDMKKFLLCENIMNYRNILFDYFNYYLTSTEDKNYCLIYRHYKENNRIKKNVTYDKYIKFLQSFKSINTELSYYFDTPRDNIAKEIYFKPIIKPEHNKHRYNTFIGYEVEYNKDYVIQESDDLKIIVNHIKRVLFSNNETLYNYFFTWLCHMFIRPETKTNIVCVFNGEMGIGKSIITELLEYILSEDYTLIISDADRLTNKFNTLLTNKVLIVVEEVMNVDDYKERMKHYEQMKQQITGKKITKEAKGKDAEDVDDYNNYILISNNEHNTLISANDRRYFCNEPDNNYIYRMSDKEKKEYFNKNLVPAIKKKSVQEEFYHWIIKNYNNDLKNMELPKSESKRKQIMLSGDSVVYFIKDFLYNYEHPNINSSELFKEYKNYCIDSGFKNLNHKYFILKLQSYLKTLEKKRTKSCYIYVIDKKTRMEMKELLIKYCFDENEYEIKQEKKETKDDIYKINPHSIKTTQIIESEDDEEEEEQEEYYNNNVDEGDDDDYSAYL